MTSREGVRSRCVFVGVKDEILFSLMVFGLGLALVFVCVHMCWAFISPLYPD